MLDIFFWKAWSKKDQLAFAVIVFVALGAIAFALYAYIGGSWIYSWDIIAERVPVALQSDYVYLGPFQFPIEKDHFILQSSYFGSSIAFYPLLNYTLLLVLSLFFSFWMAFLTTLKRFYFFFTLGIACFFIIGMRLEILEMFGRLDRVFIFSVMAAYAISAFVLHYFTSSWSLFKRWLVFVLITLVVAMVIQSYSTIPTPFLLLSTQTLWLGCIISLFFVVLIANEIITLFVRITASLQSQPGTSSLLHLTILSLIYILYLSLVFMHKMGVITWQDTEFNAMYLLTISVIAGLWGFRKREVQYGNLFSFRFSGLLLYLSLAIITYVFIGFLAATENLPFLEAMMDSIWYIHMGYGILFFIYVLANFVGPYTQGIVVTKILYNPKYMPYITFQIMGTIACIALFSATNYDRSLNKMISGYYIALSDVYTQNDNLLLAESYLKESHIYSNYNSRAMHSLANLANRYEDNKVESHYYLNTISRKPLPHTFTNLAALYAKNGQTFDALETLTKGVNAFPYSAELKNNLMLAYANFGQVDSALYMGVLAQENERVSQYAKANMLGVIAQKLTVHNADSIWSLLGDNEDPVSIANAYVVYSNSNQFFDNKSRIDTVVNLLTKTAQYEQALNAVYGKPDSVLIQLVDRESLIQSARDRLEFSYAKGWALLSTGEVNKSLAQFEALAYENYAQSPKLNQLMGLLCLQSTQPKLARAYFEKASFLENGKKSIPYLLSLLYTEPLALKELEADSLGLDKLEDLQFARSLLSILKKDTKESPTSDLEQFVNCFTRLKELDFSKINQEVTALAYLNALYEQKAIFYLNTGNLEKLNQLSQEAVSGNVSIEVKQWFNREAQILSNDTIAIEQLFQRINKDKNIFDPQLLAIKARYYANKKDTAQLNKILPLLGANALYETGVVLSGSLLLQNSPMEAYDVLSENRKVNPFSIRILKAYIRTCLSLDYTQYLDEPLEELRIMLPQKDWEEFELEVQTYLQENEDW